MQTGKVVSFKSIRGFGFIKPDEGGSDIFVHYSCINMDGYRSLEPGQRVQFEVEVGGPHNKPQAVQVEIIEGV